VRRRAVAIAVALSGVIAIAAVAHAHLGHVILRAERYLKLDASESDTRLVVSLTLGASEGERILRAADADGSGAVSEGEADAYLAQWGEGLRTDVPIEIDGAPFAATWTEGYMEPLGAVAPTPLTVEITAHLPVTGRDHEVRFRDHMRREVFDRTDVAFRAHDGAELVTCGPGEAPTERATDTAFGSALGGERAADPDTFTARLRYPRRSEGGATNVALALGVFVVVVLAAGLYQRRRRTG
jgi:hypothetical protein